MWLLFATSLCEVWFGSALMGDDQTSVAKMLNAKIAASDSGVYTGGSNPGVMVRTPDFFDGGGIQTVVPATLWHNDIYAPSQMYPTISLPWCPNNGWDGFYNTDTCANDPVGPWTFATVAVVMAGAMESMYTDFKKIMDPDWGWGVFYGSDSNAADSRCLYLANDGGWDCPGGWIDEHSGEFFADHSRHGSGGYAPGNPDATGVENGGGGSGCHYDSSAHAIDQPDATSDKGDLVSDSNCQCNYKFRDDWNEWVEVWTWHTQQKPGFENRDWLDGSGKLAPAWGVDTAACWVNNPRDMIGIQNALYWQRSSWNNQLIPASDWSSKSSEEYRKYWGWNEIPVSKLIVDDALNWDAIIIKLPADLCENGAWGGDDIPDCLSADGKNQLEQDLDLFVQQGKLVPGMQNAGNRPGSYILFAREYGQTYGASGGDDFGVNWSRYFFCTNWVSPSGKYQVVHANPGDDSVCYFDYASSQPTDQLI